MHVGALAVNRRQRLGRKIVDLDHFHHGVMRGRQFLALGLGDDALLHAFLPVMNSRGMQSLADILGSRNQLERLLQPRHAAVIVDMRQIRCQPIACRRRLQDDLGAFVHHAVGGAEHARTEWLQEEFQDQRDEAVRQIAEDFGEPVLDDSETVRHAPFQCREVRLLTALVLQRFSAAESK